MSKTYNYQNAGTLTVTTTGNIDDLDPQGNSVILMNNASAATIRGIANGYPGRIISIYSIGAGQVNLSPQNSNSLAYNRLINILTSADTPLAAGFGYATYIYDDVTLRWRLLEAEQGAWISYTVSWTAATANPAIGNGTLTGKYYLKSKNCQVKILLQTGSTTTFGTGLWSFSLPFTGTAVSGLVNMGTVLVFDSGTAFFTGITWQDSTTTCTGAVDNSTNLFSTNNPMVWNGTNGDYAKFYGTFEVS